MKQALALAAVLLSLTSCASLFNTQSPLRDDHLHVELVPLQGAAADAVTLPDEVVFHADLAHDSEDAGK